jgi:hypothetical protein
MALVSSGFKCIFGYLATISSLLTSEKMYRATNPRREHLPFEGLKKEISKKEGNDGARQQGWTGGICLVGGRVPPFFCIACGFHIHILDKGRCSLTSSSSPPQPSLTRHHLHHLSPSLSFTLAIAAQSFIFVSSNSSDRSLPWILILADCLGFTLGYIAFLPCLPVHSWRRP